MGWTRRRSRVGYEDAAGPFARRLGFFAAERMVRRRLALPLDPAHEANLRAHRKASAAGYVLSTFADRWPDAFLADRCVGRRMSTDVPMGEQEFDEEEWDERRCAGARGGSGRAEPGQGDDGGP